MPGLLNALGVQGLYDYINGVLRLAGAGLDMQFKLQEGQGTQSPSPVEPAAPPAEPVPAGAPQFFQS